jgi:ABC-2 type transport system ATP-binding protein
MTAAQVLAFGVSKRFGSLQALDGVDVSLHGGLLTLLGPNGSGKTTLLRCLATIVTPDAGSLLIDGLDPHHEADRIEIRRRLGYLPQEPGLASSAKVFDVVDYIAVLKRHTDERRRRAEVFRCLERVGLADRAGDKIRQLSGGMRQRVALAQALLGDPSLLLLDEPAAGLDPDERFRLREIVSERRRACTVLQSTHLTDEAAVSDTVLVMSAGRIVFAGPPTRLAEQAAGRTWIQQAEPRDVRAYWRQANGWYRCLGDPPADAPLVAPTLEDGYLLLQPSVLGATAAAR